MVSIGLILGLTITWGEYKTRVYEGTRKEEV